MLFLVSKTCPKEYDHNQLSNPEIEKYFALFSLEKDVLYFLHGPGKHPGKFV